MSGGDITGDCGKAGKKNWRSVAFWAGVFLARVALIVAAGAVIGAIVFPLWGIFYETGRTAGQLAVMGARFLAFIFGIWAPAVSLVLCVMKAWRRNSARESAGVAGRRAQA